MVVLIVLKTKIENMKRFFLFAVSGLFAYQTSNAAEPGDSTRIELTSHSLVSSGQVPFWLEMNRMGEVSDDMNGQQVFVFDASHFSSKEGKKVSLEYGASLVGRFGSEQDVYAEQYWGKLDLGQFYLLAGAKAEPVWGNGLSLTNGDLYLSNNARPLPRGEFGFNGLTPFSGWFNRFSFDLRYSEYLLTDDRYVDHVHLHHKKFILNYQASNSLIFHMGLDHWVFWGGTSPDPNVGKMPGFSYYLRYIFGQSGGSDSPETDQLNAAGNSLGHYIFSADLLRPEFKLQFYWQHLFEDSSGIIFKNMKDGIWGISYTGMKKKSLVQRAVLEYVYTLNQSGGRQSDGRDNYFNHGVYKSGFVAYNRMIGCPLFVPTIENGISTGFSSTRLWGFHTGVSGYLSDNVTWSGRATYSKYYGTYNAPFDYPLNLVSLEAGCHLKMKRVPLEYEIKMATDMGDYEEDSFGMQFSLFYRLR